MKIGQNNINNPKTKFSQEKIKNPKMDPLPRNKKILRKILKIQKLTPSLQKKNQSEKFQKSPN